MPAGGAAVRYGRMFDRATHLAAAGCLVMLFASCAGGEATGYRAGGTPVEFCDVVTKLVAANSRISGKDLASMRAEVPGMATLSAQLVEVAPGALRTEAVALADSIERWQSTIAKPDLVLEPDTLYLWETPEGHEAGQAILTWAVKNCEEPVDREALKPQAVLLCLPASATSGDVQAVLARASTPSKTGRGVELLEGIAGVAAQRRAVRIELDPRISPERKSQLLHVLGAPPVEAVREGADACT